MNILQIVSLVVLIIIVAGSLYWYTLAIGSALPRKPLPVKPPRTRFAVTIPAHNEEDVIAETVRQILAADYPAEMLRVFVVADHCDDQTAPRAAASRASVYERAEDPRGSKGAALLWLFKKIFALSEPFDVFVIFDSDSSVHPDFFKTIDQQFQAGERVVQGNHVIVNPQDGWIPALVWAMFLIDNRFQNIGRVNLGFSAKNMGDAICFKAEVLRQFGYGEGLTEDYAFRQQLLLENIKIAFEPKAISYGQAPWSWQIIQKQRLRWIRGAMVANTNYRQMLWSKGLRERNLAMIEGAVQGVVPSYSMLTLATELAWLAHLALLLIFPAGGWLGLFIAWTVLSVLLFVYPFFALALERAPLKGYLAILTGPLYILGRIWLSIKARLQANQVTWVRTPHRQTPTGRPQEK